MNAELINEAKLRETFDKWDNARLASELADADVTPGMEFTAIVMKKVMVERGLAKFLEDGEIKLLPGWQSKGV